MCIYIYIYIYIYICVCVHVCAMKCKCSQLIACHIDSTMTADMSTTWALLSAVPSAKPLDSGNVDAICIQRNESNGRNRSNRRHGATAHQRLRNLPPMQKHAQIYAGRTNYSSHHYSSERCIISPTPIHACAHAHVQIGTHISLTYTSVRSRTRANTYPNEAP